MTIDSRTTELVWQALAPHAPRDFRLTHISASRDQAVLTVRGALPSTMHLGRVTVDLDSGVASFVDEDHRDGGDHEYDPRTLSGEEIERIRVLLSDEPRRG